MWEYQRVLAWGPVLSLMWTVGMLIGRAKIYFWEATHETKCHVDNPRVLCPKKCLGSGNRKRNVISCLYQLWGLYNIWVEVPSPLNGPEGICLKKIILPGIVLPNWLCSAFTSCTLESGCWNQMLEFGWIWYRVLSAVNGYTVGFIVSWNNPQFMII